MAKGCSSQDKLMGALAKHAQEVGRMRSPRYQDLTQCVEAALTIMRLSCEQYFTLISVFAAYLLFRQRLPPIARQVIWVNHRVSNIFKKVMLLFQRRKSCCMLLFYTAPLELRYIARDILSRCTERHSLYSGQ